MNISELQKERKSGRWERNKTKNRLKKMKKKIGENYITHFPKHKDLKCCIYGGKKRKIS